MTDPRPVPDAVARTRIVTELDRNLIVEAGAGSGKTHELAQRMAAGIATGVYHLDGLAAVTFTRKAAAELRGRFQLALEAELKASAQRAVVGQGFSPADQERFQRIRSALSNLERFFAGTIHSFCARLLRERPVEAGVSPGFTELDDAEERMVRQQSWRNFRAQAKAAGDADLEDLLDAGITAKQLDKAFETVCLYEDVEFPTGDAALPDAAKAWRALEKYWKALSALLPEKLDPESTCKTQERADRFRRMWRGYLRGNRDSAFLANLMRCWESTPKVVQKWWSSRPLAKEAEALHEAFRDTTVLPYLTAWRRYLYGRCIALLVKGRASAEEERRRRNALSFNDLLILTAKVLRENGAVRRALQQKYRWLLVDEFQDTDPVQAEIMLLLAADESAVCVPSHVAPSYEGRDRLAPLDWRTVPLRPGALFVVGDPKQSIYRFRRADIDIYNEVRARLADPDGSGLVRLTTNFRSVPGLCAWANGVFRDLFPAAPTPQAPAFAPLDPSGKPSAAAAPIAFIDIPDTVDAGDVAVDEASRIARYIRAEVAAGPRTYGDFLILTRKKKGLRPYADALEKLQVPIEVTGAGAFSESEEVQAIALLLAALSDPQDAVALVGVLRGPLFGLSDPDLFAFRQAGGYFNVFFESGVGQAFRLAESESGAARVTTALDSLRRWFTWTRRLPAGAALERILDDSGYLALAATSRGGVEAGDLLHAIDRIRAVVEDGFTLAEAADALAAWCGLDGEPEDSTDVDSLPLEPGRSDVVRLMNLHKAKGLEAAVVFLADPFGGYPPRVDIRVVRDGARARGYFRIVEEKDNWVTRAIAEPEGWDALEQEERDYVEAETNRLLYVAATRAKDMLVVSRYAGKARGTPAWDVLINKVTNAPVLAVPSSVPPPTAVTLDLSTATAEAAANNAAALHERARQPSWSATSVTADAKRLPRVVLDPADLADSADADPTRVVVPDTPSHRADAGAAWGTLVHGLLEHAMRHRAATRDDLRRLALWLTVEEPRLRDVIDHAIDTALAVVASEELIAARASAECHEEAPFAVRDDDGGRPVVVTGAIDLVYRQGEQWAAVDYKTDADAKDIDLAARHKKQIEMYELAWGKVSGRAVNAKTIAARMRL